MHVIKSQARTDTFAELRHPLLPSVFAGLYNR
jgi:hypothetical protein